MPKIFCCILLLPVLMFATGCTVFVSADGSKHKQLFPAKDKASITDMDTSRFVRKGFVNFNNNKTKADNRKTVVPITGTALQTLINSGDLWFVYFADPGCKAAKMKTFKIDSLSKAGQKVIVISLRKSYDAIDKLLSTTSFSQQPYFVIEDKKYGSILLDKQINIIKEACPSCYAQHRDDLAIVDYMILGRGQVQLINFKDPSNIFYH